MPPTILAAANALRRGEVSSVELTRAGYARADHLEDVLGVYLSRFDETALAAAERADRDLAAGRDIGPLHGIPIGVKDIILTEEGPTSANSLVRNPAWLVCRDARVVSNLRAAGAIITGKLTTLEFATGAPDPDGPWMLPRTPWNPDCWAGGSSSGSANGVAAGCFLGALGTDTAGSVRLPAAYCGITGLKPTFGRVSLDGVIPLSTTLDCVGPMTRTATDAAVMLQAMAGHHSSDPSTVDVGQPELSRDLEQPLTGLRVGVERANHLTHADMDTTTRDVFEEAVEVLAQAGASVTEVVLPNYRDMVDANMVTLLADGLAYHHRRLREQWESFQKTTRLAYASAALFSSADYVQVQRVRRAIRRRVNALFQDVDVITGPTTATAAPRAERDIEVSRVMASIFTPFWSATGHPAITVPMGFNHGLPLAMQIAGRHFDEPTVLRVASAFQRSTNWHLRVPPLIDVPPTTLQEVNHV